MTEKKKKRFMMNLLMVDGKLETKDLPVLTPEFISRKCGFGTFFSRKKIFGEEKHASGGFTPRPHFRVHRRPLVEYIQMRGKKPPNAPRRRRFKDFP